MDNIGALTTMPKPSYCYTTCSDCYHCELADDPGRPIEFEPDDFTDIEVSQVVPEGPGPEVEDFGDPIVEEDEE